MTIERPVLKQAVAGEKSKASDYNENFEKMMSYVDDAIDCVNDAVDYVDNTLTIYTKINTLGTSGTIALTTNTINKITPVDDVTFTLPTIEDNTLYNQILVQVKLTNTYSITLGTNYFFDLVKPTFNTTGVYDIMYEYDSNIESWVCGAVYKGVVL